MGSKREVGKIYMHTLFKIWHCKLGIQLSFLSICLHCIQQEVKHLTPKTSKPRGCLIPTRRRIIQQRDICSISKVMFCRKKSEQVFVFYGFSNYTLHRILHEQSQELINVCDTQTLNINVPQFYPQKTASDINFYCFTSYHSIFKKFSLGVFFFRCFTLEFLSSVSSSRLQ